MINFVSEQVPPDPHAYELYGFDFMLDDTGRSWLIEVNRSPSMAMSDHAQLVFILNLCRVLAS